MLEVNRVLGRNGEIVDLSPEFRAALGFRDLLESRISFADKVWPDIHNLFTPLLNDLPSSWRARRRSTCFVTIDALM